jgi:hypothetical protein
MTSVLKPLVYKDDRGAWEREERFTKILSFPRSAWECHRDAPRRAGALDAEHPGPAFPRGAWEREERFTKI